MKRKQMMSEQVRPGEGLTGWGCLRALWAFSSLFIPHAWLTQVFKKKKKSNSKRPINQFKATQAQRLG